MEPEKSEISSEKMMDSAAKRSIHVDEDAVRMMSAKSFAGSSESSDKLRSVRSKYTKHLTTLARSLGEEHTVSSLSEAFKISSILLKAMTDKERLSGLTFEIVCELFERASVEGFDTSSQKLRFLSKAVGTTPLVRLSAYLKMIRHYLSIRKFDTALTEATNKITQWKLEDDPYATCILIFTKLMWELAEHAPPQDFIKFEPEAALKEISMNIPISRPIRRSVESILKNCIMRNMCPPMQTVRIYVAAYFDDPQVALMMLDSLLAAFPHNFMLYKVKTELLQMVLRDSLKSNVLDEEDEAGESSKLRFSDANEKAIEDLKKKLGTISLEYLRTSMYDVEAFNLIASVDWESLLSLEDRMKCLSEYVESHPYSSRAWGLLVREIYVNSPGAHPHLQGLRNAEFAVEIKRRFFGDNLSDAWRRRYFLIRSSCWDGVSIFTLAGILITSSLFLDVLDDFLLLYSYFEWIYENTINQYGNLLEAAKEFHSFSARKPFNLSPSSNTVDTSLNGKIEESERILRSSREKPRGRDNRQENDEVRISEEDAESSAESSLFGVFGRSEVEEVSAASLIAIERFSDVLLLKYSQRACVSIDFEALKKSLFFLFQTL